MPHYKLAFLGFGNVGKALAELLMCKREEIAARYGTFSITGIATGRHGIAIDPQGLDLLQALERVNAGQSLQDLSTGSPACLNSLDFIRDCGAQVLFESTPVNYETGQPAVDYIRAALQAGMHVASANKGPVVHAYQELTAFAAARGRKFYFESAVMDGAPIFGLYRETLPAAQITAFRGVLNSTTNLILSRMETGESLEDAVHYAQSFGIAETDPSGDIDGWDAAVKVSALATVWMDTPTKPQQIERTGIRGITPEDIAAAKAQGKRWKLVCEARKRGDKLYTRVSPQMVSADSPLYGVEGTSSIVQIESDVLGKLSLLEEDPGPHTTAYGLLADFLNAVRE
jgi:homoserine dehydrogenase